MMEPQKVSERTGIKGFSAANPVHAKLRDFGKNGTTDWRFVGLDKGGVAGLVSKWDGSVGAQIVELGVMRPPIVAGHIGFRGMLGAGRSVPLQSARALKSSVFGLGTVLGTPFVAPIMTMLSPMCLAIDNASVFDCILPVVVDVVPDQEKYERAIIQAKQRDRVDERWPGLQQRYDVLMSMVDKLNARAEDPRLTQARAQEKLAAAYVDEWQRRVLAQAKEQSAVTIINVSGWPERGVKERLSDSVRWSVSKPSWSKGRLPQLSDLKPNILPARDIDEFDERLGAEKKRIKSIVEDYDRGMDSAMMQRQASLGALRQELDLNNAVVSVDGADLFRQLDRDHWSYRDDVDLQERRLEGGKLVEPKCICVTLTGQRFERVTPQYFRMSDKAVDVQYRHGTVSIRNITHNYITVDAMSFYYGRDVNTKGGANFLNYREIAPGATVEIYDVSNQVDAYASSFTVSRAEAANINIHFGLAIKYRMTHDTTPRSLFQTKDYTLLSLIEG